MITSKYIIDISEEYSKTGLVRNRQVDIYENPTSSDFIKLEKSAREHNRKLDKVRFIADINSHKVYLADSYNIIHDDMGKVLGFNVGYYPPERFEGTGTVSGGQAKATKWDSFQYISQLKFPSKTEIKFLEGTFGYDWTWVDRYVSGTSSLINSCKEKYKSLMKK